MVSANKLRGASFLRCLVFFCALSLYEPSFAAAAEIIDDDGGDGDVDVGDIILLDAAAVDTTTDDAKIDGSNIQTSQSDQYDNENPSSPKTTQPSDEESSHSSQEDILLGETSASSASSGSYNINYDESKPLQYTPPTHFQITAHVQTNLHTGYSYFLPSESSLPASFAHLPFLECGAVGSTTESLPLVSGVFRHVPHTAVVPGKRDDVIDVVLENLEHGIIMEEGENDHLQKKQSTGLDMLNDEDPNSKSNQTYHDDTASSENFESSDDHPKRPSPPKYVVALSSMEITVGGNGNETQKFNAGDVIFIEDTWWGVWDDELLDNESSDNNVGDLDETSEESSSDETRDVKNDETNKLKGYIMRASSESQTDLNVLMLTVPNAIHRHWKNAQYAMATAKREEQREAKQQQRQHQSSTLNMNTNEFGTRRPWWKLPTTFLHKHNSKQQQQQAAFVPQPCSLELDPAFAHPSAVSSTTLSQHFTQHFVGLMSKPHPSFLPHHHQDLLLPILAQTGAAMVGGAGAFALVLQLWRVIPGPIAVLFGSACLISVGTFGVVWLGEEILDQWELWRERRRLERMMSEGWGKGGSMMMEDA